MRSINVTFRAIFEQPKGKLNPMGLKLPGPMPVEIFGSGEKWQARSLSAHPVVYKNLQRFTTPEQGMYVVQDSFERQVEAWQMWGIPPEVNLKEPKSKDARMLLPEEIADLGKGKFGFRQPEDYTHIIHAQSVPPGAKIPPAACGTSVNANCFISTKANVRPSCRKCAEVWEEHYQGKSA